MRYWKPFLYVGLLGLLLIVLITVAWQLTLEPAPNIHVRWKPEVSAERRADLEHQFLLVNPENTVGTTWAYDLLDTGEQNVERLVTDPAVDDTHEIDRAAFHVRSDAPAGDSSTWVAYRVPVLRGMASRPRLFSELLWVTAGCFVVAVVGYQRGRKIATREKDEPTGAA